MTLTRLFELYQPSIFVTASDHGSFRKPAAALGVHESAISSRDLEEQDFILSSLAPSTTQKRLALGVVLVLLLGFIITAGPLSSIQLARVDAFIPAYAAAMLVNNSITAVLLFAQFSMLRSRALLAISSGYLFTALILVLWAPTFPGVFAPGGLLAAGLQTTAWLSMVWHAGFPTFVIAYAMLKDRDPAERLSEGPVSVAILSSVAITASIVCAAAFLVIAGDELLPHLMLDRVHLSGLWPYAAGFASLLSLCALVLLWVRRRSVLDLWLMVVMCAFVIKMVLISFPVPARYTVGWYSGRVFSPIRQSCSVCVVVRDNEPVCAAAQCSIGAAPRAAGAGDDSRRGVGLHEIKQPLSAMIINAGAGVRWLDREPPEPKDQQSSKPSSASRQTWVLQHNHPVSGPRSLSGRSPRDRPEIFRNRPLCEGYYALS